MSPAVRREAIPVAVPARSVLLVSQFTRATSCRLVPTLVAGSLVPAVLLMSYAYSYASTHGREQTHFHLFWFSVLVFLIPVGLRMCAGAPSRTERLALLGLLGLFDYLPKFLRDPGYPLYQDELAHWRQAEGIYNSGTLFQPNPIISVLQFFPGLHGLTVALRYLTGLSTYSVGVILIAVLHVIALVGVFVIADRMTGSTRAAGLAAFLYSLNPSFMYFDAQYSYESLAIVVLIWVVVAVVHIQNSSSDTQQRAWFATGIVLAAACTVIHHLTTYTLVVLLLIITGVTIVRAALGLESRRNAVVTACFATVVACLALDWLLLAASDTFGYLAPYLPGGLSEIARMISHEHQSRALFARSTTPSYERAFAFLSPAIAAGATAVSLWVARRTLHRLSVWYGLVLFGLLYFPSVPFILTRAGNEGARRSWAFTYLGLCLLVAPALTAFLQRASAGRFWIRNLSTTCVIAVICIVAIGNVAMHLNEEYRFPGQYVYGSDTRSQTPEILGMTRWFRNIHGIDQRMIADRYTGMVLGSLGNEWIAVPSAGFPVWQLYFQSQSPDIFLLDELRTSDYQYMVVDKHMVHDLPRVGIYFNNSEPLQFKPPPPGGIEKYEYLPWATKIYTSDNLEIFRLNFNFLHVRGYLY